MDLWVLRLLQLQKLIFEDTKTNDQIRHCIVEQLREYMFQSSERNLDKER